MSESWVGLAEMRLLAVCGCREPSLEADRFATAARLASGGGMLPALRPINQQIRHLPVPTLGSFRRIEWRGSQLQQNHRENVCASSSASRPSSMAGLSPRPGS